MWTESPFSRSEIISQRFDGSEGYMFYLLTVILKFVHKFIFLTRRHDYFIVFLLPSNVPYYFLDF